MFEYTVTGTTKSINRVDKFLFLRRKLKHTRTNIEGQNSHHFLAYYLRLQIL